MRSRGNNPASEMEMTCRGCISLGVTTLASLLLKGFYFTLPVLGHHPGDIGSFLQASPPPCMARGFGQTLLSQQVPLAQGPEGEGTEAARGTFGARDTKC